LEVGWEVKGPQPAAAAVGVDWELFVRHSSADVESGGRCGLWGVFACVFGGVIGGGVASPAKCILS
jgi:hypothetical protein